MIFEDGKLIKEIDRSEDMKRLREVEKLNNGGRISSRLNSSVEAAFSLDYKDKWI